MIKNRIYNLFTITSVILLLFSIIKPCLSQIILTDNIPSISFTKSTQTFDAISTRQISLGDLDGDGDLDAVFSSFHFGRVMMNDGKGYFTDSGQEMTRYGHGVDVGDLDGDGDLDLFMINANLDLAERSAVIYFNDGSGNFIDSGQNLGDSNINGLSIQLLDIDFDGDLDAYIFYAGQGNILYINDSNGQFQKSTISFPNGNLGDIDGDGDFDIFMRESGQGYRTMLNDGQFNFTDHWQMVDSTVLYGTISLVDLDKDKNPDVLVGNYDNSISDSTRVFLNDGTGQYTLSHQKLGPAKWASFSMGDLDCDNTIDVFISNYTLPNEIWLNEENGRLMDSGLRMGGSEPNGISPLGDLDGDGDLDIFVAFFGEGSNSVWFNETITSIRERRNSHPNTSENYRLFQNYPNPFNAETSISFQIIQPANITLKIYNVLGKVVQTVINNSSYDEGWHSIKFDAGTFESGIYFYKLTSNFGFKQVKKMCIIK